MDSKTCVVGWGWSDGRGMWEATVEWNGGLCVACFAHPLRDRALSLAMGFAGALGLSVLVA